jgi:hypothetical protein
MPAARRLHRTTPCQHWTKGRCRYAWCCTECHVAQKVKGVTTKTGAAGSSCCGLARRARSPTLCRSCLTKCKNLGGKHTSRGEPRNCCCQQRPAFAPHAPLSRPPTKCYPVTPCHSLGALHSPCSEPWASRLCAQQRLQVSTCVPRSLSQRRRRSPIQEQPPQTHRTQPTDTSFAHGGSADTHPASRRLGDNTAWW